MNNLTTATIAVKDDISGKSYAYYQGIGLWRRGEESPP
jgi:hypothetical protein